MADDQEDDPIKTAYEKSGFKPRLVPPDPDVHFGSDDEFPLFPLRIHDPRAIPHRQWIYGTQLIRAFVSLLVAPGGTGKSSMLLAMAMSIATGRPLLSTRVHQPCNVAVLNLEDPQEEINRRVSALAQHYGLTQADVDGRLFCAPAEQTVTVATIGADGFSVVHPDEKRIIRRIRELNIGVLMVDPFAESHNLEENNNPQMVAAAASWRRIARAGNCAVLLAHHVRKGTADSIEAARGAKSLTDSARIGLMLSTMSEDEANTLGIDPEQRQQYVRMDDAKANMAARLPKATWFRLANVTLDNADATFAQGDRVGVIEPWRPKTVWETVSSIDSDRALDLIEAGMPDGKRYTDNRRGGGERWVGHLLMRVCDVTEKQAATMIKTWVKNGVLVIEEYREAKHRKKLDGLYVSAANRPGARL